MIGKIIAGQSFGGTVGYVMKKDAQVLDSEGVNPPEVKDLVQDFEDQGELNPRIKNKVGHISLSFSEQDKMKLSDKIMTEIAREYMQKMGIENTQFLIVRHHDSPHPHCYVVYNRVDNDGKTITDSLKTARNWGDLTDALSKQGIGTEFKFKGIIGINEGVKFLKNGYTFWGSKIDRQFSFSKLDSHFNNLQKNDKKLKTAVDATLALVAFFAILSRVTIVTAMIAAICFISHTYGFLDSRGTSGMFT